MTIINNTNSSGKIDTRINAPRNIVFDYIDETNFASYINSRLASDFLVKLKKDNFKLWNLLAQNGRDCAALNAEQKKYLFELFNKFFINNYRYGTYIEITADSDKKRYSHILHSKYGDKFLALLAKHYPSFHKKFVDCNFEISLMKDTDQNLFFKLFNQFFKTRCAHINIENPAPAIAKHIEQAKKKIYVASALVRKSVGARHAVPTQPRRIILKRPSSRAPLFAYKPPQKPKKQAPGEWAMIQDFIAFYKESLGKSYFDEFCGKKLPDPVSIYLKDAAQVYADEELKYIYMGVQYAIGDNFEFARQNDAMFVVQDHKTGKYILYDKRALKNNGYNPDNIVIVRDNNNGKILIYDKAQLVNNARQNETFYQNALAGANMAAEKWNTALASIFKSCKGTRAFIEADKKFKEKYGERADIALTVAKFTAYGIVASGKGAPSQCDPVKSITDAVAGAVKGLLIDVPATLLHCIVNPLLAPLFFFNITTPEGFKQFKTELYRTMTEGNEAEIAAYLSFNLFMAVSGVKHAGSKLLQGAKTVGARCNAPLLIKLTKERISVIIDGKEYADTAVVNEVIKGLQERGLQPSAVTIKKAKQSIRDAAGAKPKNTNHRGTKDAKPAARHIPPAPGGGNKKLAPVPVTITERAKRGALRTMETIIDAVTGRGNPRGQRVAVTPEGVRIKINGADPMARKKNKPLTMSANSGEARASGKSIYLQKLEHYLSTEELAPVKDMPTETIEGIVKENTLLRKIFIERNNESLTFSRATYFFELLLMENIKKELADIKNKLKIKSDPVSQEIISGLVCSKKEQLLDFLQELRAFNKKIKSHKNIDAASEVEQLCGLAEKYAVKMEDIDRIFEGLLTYLRHVARIPEDVGLEGYFNDILSEIKSRMQGKNIKETGILNFAQEFKKIIQPEDIIAFAAKFKSEYFLRKIYGEKDALRTDGEILRLVGFSESESAVIDKINAAIQNINSELAGINQPITVETKGGRCFITDLAQNVSNGNFSDFITQFGRIFKETDNMANILERDYFGPEKYTRVTGAGNPFDIKMLRREVCPDGSEVRYGEMTVPGNKFASHRILFSALKENGRYKIYLYRWVPDHLLADKIISKDHELLWWPRSNPVHDAAWHAVTSRMSREKIIQKINSYKNEFKSCFNTEALCDEIMDILNKEPKSGKLKQLLKNHFPPEEFDVNVYFNGLQIEFEIIRKDSALLLSVLGGGDVRLGEPIEPPPQPNPATAVIRKNGNSKSAANINPRSKFEVSENLLKAADPIFADIINPSPKERAVHDEIINIYRKYAVQVPLELRQLFLEKIRREVKQQKPRLLELLDENAEIFKLKAEKIILDSMSKIEEDILFFKITVEIDAVLRLINIGMENRAIKFLIKHVSIGRKQKYFELITDIKNQTSQVMKARLIQNLKDMLTENKNNAMLMDLVRVELGEPPAAAPQGKGTMSGEQRQQIIDENLAEAKKLGLIPKGRDVFTLTAEEWELIEKGELGEYKKTFTKLSRLPGIGKHNLNNLSYVTEDCLVGQCRGKSLNELEADSRWLDSVSSRIRTESEAMESCNAINSVINKRLGEEIKFEPVFDYIAQLNSDGKPDQAKQISEKILNYARLMMDAVGNNKLRDILESFRKEIVLECVPDYVKYKPRKKVLDWND